MKVYFLRHKQNCLHALDSVEDHDLCCFLLPDVNIFMLLSSPVKMMNCTTFGIKQEKYHFLLSFPEASGSLLITLSTNSILFRFHTALQSINEEQFHFRNNTKLDKIKFEQGGKKVVLKFLRFQESSVELSARGAIPLS